MSDIIFIKLAAAILLVVFVYTFAFWFGYEKGVKEKQVYKEELAAAIEEKMHYMGTCPNEKDTILHMVDSEHFHVDKIPHCKTDCWHKKCESYSASMDFGIHDQNKKDTYLNSFSPEARALGIENVIEYKGYHAAVFYDSRDNILIGKVCWISDDLTFEAWGVSQIQTAFHNTIDQYLEFCKEKGKSPCKECIPDLSR